MSPSSRESNLAQLRESLAQLNSEFFLSLKERRTVCVKIQEFKRGEGRYAHYDPDREKQLFLILKTQLLELSLKELLAFSLVMEDQAQAFAPGAYPNWSTGVHLVDSQRDLLEMINPLLLKITHPELYQKLSLGSDFQFLSDF